MTKTLFLYIYDCIIRFVSGLVKNPEDGGFLASLLIYPTTIDGKECLLSNYEHLSMQYTEFFFSCKKTIHFSGKKYDIFNIHAKNIDCGYTLEPPRHSLDEAVLTSTHTLCFSWYKYLIVSLVFSHLGFWSGNLFLTAPFPDLCLLVPFLDIK